jgi:hypothetical protein
MRTILGLHFPSGSIVDVNHSLGVFYSKVNREVIGVDIRPLATVQADNRNLPFASNSFSVGVCDPPYRRGNGDTKYTDRYGKAPYTAKRVTQQYFDLLPELLRVSRDGIIIKAQDETDGHRFYFRTGTLVDRMKELTGLEPHDVAYLVKSGVMDNNVEGRERHFMANCISYFLVYKWREKYKPFRFMAASNNASTRTAGILPPELPLFSPEVLSASEGDR